MNKNINIKTEQKITRIYYYKTNIVSFNRDKIYLKTEGHNTKSTKDNMNKISEMFDLKYNVIQKDKKWYVNFKDLTLPFINDSIIFNRF